MARGFNLTAILGDLATAVTATGTTQAGAAPMPAGFAIVDTVTSSADGVILRAQGPMTVSGVANTDSADNLMVYPWSGASFNGGTADLPLTLPPNKSALFVEMSSTKIMAFF